MAVLHEFVDYFVVISMAKVLVLQLMIGDMELVRRLYCNNYHMNTQGTGHSQNYCRYTLTHLTRTNNETMKVSRFRVYAGILVHIICSYMQPTATDVIEE